MGHSARPATGFIPASTGVYKLDPACTSVGIPLPLNKTVQVIIDLKPMITSVGESQMPTPSKSLEDEIDRQIDAMTDEERMAVVMSMAGTWTHIEESSPEEWEFIDWDAPDDLPV